MSGAEVQDCWTISFFWVKIGPVLFSCQNSTLIANYLPDMTGYDILNMLHPKNIVLDRLEVKLRPSEPKALVTDVHGRVQPDH